MISWDGGGEGREDTRRGSGWTTHSPTIPWPQLTGLKWVPDGISGFATKKVKPVFL